MIVRLQGIEILLIACDEAMADESIELEQQPRTQATDDDEEVYHEAEEGGEAAFDDVGEVSRSMCFIQKRRV